MDVVRNPVLHVFCWLIFVGEVATLLLSGSITCCTDSCTSAVLHILLTICA